MNPEQIIEYIEAYNINTIKSPDGYCYGLASIARDAFLLGSAEYHRYRNRLDAMNQDDFLTQMKAFIKEAQLLSEGDIKISPISAEKLKQWPALIVYAAISLGKPENKINTNDLYSIYLETRAFLETMTILFEPDFHQSLFAKKAYINQFDHETVIPLMASVLSQQQGGTTQVTQFMDMYSDEEMTEHLKGISSIQTEKRFAMMLSCCNHTIALLYERDKKQWILDDHGDLSTYPNSEAGLVNLSKNLKYSLSESKENHIVYSIVNSLGHDQHEVTQAFSSFCKEDKNRLKEKLIKNEVSAQEISDLLYLASIRGDLNVVTALLNHPLCNPNKQNKQNNNYTALHMAAQNGHVDVIKALLKHADYSPNKQNNESYTALHLAAERGHVDVVNALLKHADCSPNIKENDGWTALHLAAQNGHLDVVKTLLVHPQIKNIKNNTGHTALHFAIKEGYLDIVWTLVEKGHLVDDKIMGFAKKYVDIGGDGHKNSKAIYVYLLNSIQNKNPNPKQYPFFKLISLDISYQYRNVLPGKKQRAICAVTQAKQILLEITDLARSENYAGVFKILNSERIFDLIDLLRRPFDNPKSLLETDKKLIALNKQYINLLTRLVIEDIVIKDNNDQLLPLANFIAQLLRSPAHNNSPFKRAIGHYSINQHNSYYKIVLNGNHHQNVISAFEDLLSILNQKVSLFTKRNTLNKINHALQNLLIKSSASAPTSEKDIAVETPTFEQLYQSLNTTDMNPPHHGMHNLSSVRM